ncbi:aldo/keto reductase [Streptomyces sp. NPDC088725]|uniref:aldo/keto reductase n=1 Tax=Streptomyces sp. NPDC088725 TaxID=3365873 RepID=UPI00382E1F1D
MAENRLLTGPRIGFGAMQLPGPGVWGPPKDRTAALAVLRRAVDIGVTHIDTADFYGPHVANDLIREALHPYPAGLTIATKVGAQRDDQRRWLPAASPAELRAQVESNLTRLGVDRLDLVYLRTGGEGAVMPPSDTPFLDSFRALADLRAEGLIAELGLSGVGKDQLAQANEVAPVVAVQNLFHLLDRTDADVLAVCEERGIAFVPYFPLAAGLLKPVPDTTRLPADAAPTAEQQRVLDEVADRHGASRSQTALAWLLARSPVIIAIPGTTSVAHLEENVAATRVELTGEDVARLTALA